MPDGEDPSTNVGGDGKNTGSGGNQGNPSPKSGSENGGSGANPNAGSDKAFTQADVDAVASRVRDEEKRKYEAKVKADKEAAEKASAEKQGEYQKLYEAEKAKTAELETKSARVDEYAKRINEVLDGETKDWPAEVKKTDPGAERLDERLQWVETHRDLAKRLLSAGQAPNMEHGRQGRTVGPTAITDNYLNSQYAPPGKA